jgi:hypothetical protein
MRNRFVPFNIILLLCVVNFGHAQVMTADSSFVLPESLAENSGITVFGKNFLFINDSSHPNLVFEITKNGKWVKSYTIDLAENNDWEEITRDDRGNFYIGDFGNNNHKRTSLCIYKFNLRGSKIEADRIDFKYEDQKKFPPPPSNRNFDAEAMIWLNGKLYLFSKNNQDPYLGYTKLYSVSDAPGIHTAQLIDSVFLGAGGFLEHSVTGAAYDPNRKLLALLTYKHLFIFFDFEGEQFFKGKMMHFTMGIVHQREAIVFTDNSDLAISDERRIGMGGNLYYYGLNRWLSGETKFDNTTISDLFVKRDGAALKLSFKSTKPGKYYAELRDPGFFKLNDVLVKSKVNEGKEILFGNIDVPVNASVFCLYLDKKLIYMNALQKIAR